MSTSLTITTGSDLELGKAVRESLRLEDGDRVLIEPAADGVVLRREEGVRLLQENGAWVFSAGQPSNYSVREILNELRDERLRKLSGE
jgi:bifunctional DNA-binding transcriptional regulator/antitoxin component of YhaV-PrlF toxin-antitoxin module